MKSISLKELEDWELIAQDALKKFIYDKRSGQWSWINCDGAGFTGFKTRLDALKDAIEPYINEEE